MKWDVYISKQWWKAALIAFGVVIGIVSLFYTETFIKELRAEEERKIVLWAKAVKTVFLSEDDSNLAFYSQIIQDNKTIPVILVNDEGKIIAHRNLDVPESNPERYLKRKLEEFKESGQVLENPYLDGKTNYLYYKGSSLLTKLRLYPLLLLGVISIYMLISYMAFSNARRSEQNKVWTGMAKETAHQIGTPLSAMLGWMAYLKDKYPGEEAFGEMERDVDRLTAITERFSKIGSQPELTHTELTYTIESSLDYLVNRLGKNVTFNSKIASDLQAKHNPQLISWVLENLITNATDALEGKGSIEVEARLNGTDIFIFVKDSGKGIPSNIQRSIFKPGYSSKSRGWGLGLSLAKRIVGEYHNGSISLVDSQLNQGSTFKITLPSIL
ncbi:MAG TPA: two-component sensor histidine kinase [Cryomorphaceae bacterium]|nr:two-component sensor histidine kinase [Cryomorphaceae bacterium]|tara:strand:- start:530 stop:1684 length:1155 start_codon:yes stop_codon:yes gene_type:complete